MNDPAMTDYTYITMLPYLNMAIDELVESLEESNSSPTNQLSAIITVPVGAYRLVPVEVSGEPQYPDDLVEVQEVSERDFGSNNGFVPLVRREFLQVFPPSTSLMFWVWEDTMIKFNPLGATSKREVQLKYIAKAIKQATNEASVIGAINARSYLAYKTASFCSMYIGENETRAAALGGDAEKALERLTGINNKGRQHIMTRHRPFRAGWKSRGGF